MVPTRCSTNICTLCRTAPLTRCWHGAFQELEPVQPPMRYRHMSTFTVLWGKKKKNTTNQRRGESTVTGSWPRNPRVRAPPGEGSSHSPSPVFAPTPSTPSWHNAGLAQLRRAHLFFQYWLLLSKLMHALSFAKISKKTYPVNRAFQCTCLQWTRRICVFSEQLLHCER